MVWFWGSGLSWYEGAVDDNVELEAVGAGFATGGVELVILVWTGLGGGMLLVSTLPLLYHMLFSWWKFDIWLIEIEKKELYIILKTSQLILDLAPDPDIILSI